jgi:hypothetical protein
MARSGTRGDRELAELGQAIIAAWFKVLPDTTGGPIDDLETMTRDELTVVLGEILDRPFELVFDPPGENAPITIVIPQPPVSSREELVDYLRRHHRSSSRHYHEDLGTALLFGCGR